MILLLHSTHIWPGLRESGHIAQGSLIALEDGVDPELSAGTVGFIACTEYNHSLTCTKDGDCSAVNRYALFQKTRLVRKTEFWLCHFEFHAENASTKQGR